MEQETIFIGNIEPKEKEVPKKEPLIIKYFTYLIIFATGLIIAAVLLVFYYEVLTPSEFCKSVGEEHSVKFFPYPPTHSCNGKVIEQYTDGWKYQLPDITFNP